MNRYEILAGKTPSPDQMDEKPPLVLPPQEAPPAREWPAASFNREWSPSSADLASWSPQVSQERRPFFRLITPSGMEIRIPRENIHIHVRNHSPDRGFELHVNVPNAGLLARITEELGSGSDIEFLRGRMGLDAGLGIYEPI